MALFIPFIAFVGEKSSSACHSTTCFNVINVLAHLILRKSTLVKSDWQDIAQLESFYQRCHWVRCENWLIYELFLELLA